MNIDLLVVGGGPAGLMAALEAAEYGVNVAIVEESSRLGGQLRQQTQYLSPLPSGIGEIRGFELANELVEAVTFNKHIVTYTNHTVIGLYEDGSVGINNGKEIIRCETKKISVATGADIQGVLFPGWTLPGVLTVGAAQILVNRERVKPGNEAFIVGSSDFSIEVALQLYDVGINVLGIVETETSLHDRKQENLYRLKEKNIPILENSYIEQAKGRGQVEKVILNQNGNKEEYDVDLICVDGGLNPVIELCQLYNCSFAFNEILGGWLPTYQANFETSTDGVFIAGNTAGITNQGAVMVTGKLAGLGAAESLGNVPEQAADVWRNNYWSELAKLENYQVNEARTCHIQNFETSKTKVYET
ncbi:sarcosine oxidase subunit alpha [Thalassobacillus cyri]|uniref:Sarcosine oxidase subunit alpha n=1 Tax=Thalassobacillus cyri TaxID=571932 RepID=A0A1H3VZG8_9BACI|nr:FAD-dependent oxidoreductase [Thalassobacillus cyri]SDZ80207.1 sarcosine oxidase subunit alpha [Thalassobacillus cyri]